MQQNKKYFYILLLICLFSFLLHAAPYFILDKTQYNFYSTDSWYAIRQIQLLNNGERISYDPLLNFPEGRDVSWGVVTAYLGSVVSYDKKSAIDIFNTSGFIAPCLLIIFALLVFVLVSYLYDSHVGFTCAIMVAFPTAIMNYNSMFGGIDHHLIETVVGTLTILCLILTARKHWLWVFVVVPLCIIGYLNSSETFLVYLFVIALISGIECCIKITKGEYIYAIPVIVGAAASIWVYIQTPSLLSRTIFLVLSWNEPILEIQPATVIDFLVHYNLLLVILIIGVVYKREIKQTWPLWVAAIVFTVLSFRFSRCELYLFPMIAILAGYYTSSKKLVLAFIIIATLLCGLTTYSIVSVSDYNKDWDGGLQFLSTQPQGIVLSWWDYGHWVLVAGEHPPYTDPFQDRVINAATIFTGKTIDPDIKYVIVDNQDRLKYDAMKYYNPNALDYNSSNLKSWIENNNAIGTLIYQNTNVKIYSVGNL